MLKGGSMIPVAAKKIPQTNRREKSLDDPHGRKILHDNTETSFIIVLQKYNLQVTIKFNKNKNVSKKMWMYIRSQGNHTECVCRKLNTKSEFAKKTSCVVQGKTTIPSQKQNRSVKFRQVASLGVTSLNIKVSQFCWYFVHN